MLNFKYHNLVWDLAFAAAAPAGDDACRIANEFMSEREVSEAYCYNLYNSLQDGSYEIQLDSEAGSLELVNVCGE